MRMSCARFVAILVSSVLVSPTIASAQCKWSIENMHDPKKSGDLEAVAAISQTDAWAVGAYFDPFLQASKPLAEHWNGNEWVGMTAPGGLRPHGRDVLMSVAPVSSGDVWAVGDEDYMTPLIEHWNGSAWTLTPERGLPQAFLAAAAAVDSSDVWIVGTSNQLPGLTFVGRWTGSTWVQVASPNEGAGSNELNGVAARSQDDVWAIGGYVDSSGAEQTLTEHWDGTAWTIVPSPNESAYSNRLDAVTVISHNDAWAVGTYSDGTRAKALVEHWNGAAWSLVHGVSPGSEFSFLYSVSAAGPQDIWTVGIRGHGGIVDTLAEHWDGSRWSVVESPDFANVQNDLMGVSAISSNEIFAVGAHGSRELGLLFHC
jgi:hypothetical protein